MFGCSDDNLCQKFFNAEDLTLKRTVDICVAHHVTRKQMSVFKEEMLDVIQKVSEKPEGRSTHSPGDDKQG